MTDQPNHYGVTMQHVANLRNHADWGDNKPEIEIGRTHGPKSMSHCATWDDYDGAPDSPTHPMGFGPNVREAISDLIETTRDTDFDDGRIEAQS